MLVPTPLPHAAEPTILVVEDEVMIRLLICEELRDAGLRVVEAENADEALSYLRADDRVDLLFTDVRMPGTMDGMALADRVRADFPALKVILTSGHMLPHEMLDGLLLIPKPYSLVKVVSQILTALGLPEAEGSEPGA